MRKIIFLVNAIEVIKILKAGKKLQGTLEYDEKLGIIKFTPNKPPHSGSKENLVDHTPFGRVTETSCSYKVYGRFPKVMGLHKIMSAIDREAKDVKAAIFTNEIIDRV